MLKETEIKSKNTGAILLKPHLMI